MPRPGGGGGGEWAAYPRLGRRTLDSGGGPARARAGRVGRGVGSVEGILRQLGNGQTNSRAPKADPAPAIPAVSGA
ncbi:hypothetical protein [Streptomyces albidoflavus]|uniref:hypothetical protein n=1 Tax=Streptomyces albidoflavus TaxID=1886 RepID=UPI001596CC95|nr:hypothetical protein [Streptomyces albidoflavus]